MDVAQVLVTMTERRKAAEAALQRTYDEHAYRDDDDGAWLELASQQVAALAVWDEAIILLGEALAEQQARQAPLVTLGTVVPA